MNTTEVAGPSIVTKTFQTAIDGGKAVFVGVYNIVTGPPK